MNSNNTFGNKLNNLKVARGYSSVELAHLAGISEGLLSGLIHDQRVIGEYTARKIAKALQLTGNELEDFVYLARVLPRLDVATARIMLGGNA